MPFGFLDFPMVLPAWVPCGIGIGWWFTCFYIGYRIFWVEKKYCPERNLLIKARTTGSPVICLVDIGSNNATLELGTKKRSDDIKFDSKFSGIRIDPVLTSVGCEPTRINSLDYYFYAFENWLPQTARNHLAYKAISEYKTKKCPDLDFLTDIEFISLVSTPEVHLAHDLNMFVSKYFKNVYEVDEKTNRSIVKMVRQFMKEDPATCTIGQDGEPIPGTGTMKKYEQEIHIPELVNRIEDIKNDISTLPISRGYFSMQEAFKNNAYAYAAQDLEMLLVIHDKQGLTEMMKKINTMVYATAVAIVCVAGGLGFYMVTMALKSMGKV